MSSSGIIQPLSTAAINQIAAGEVIDRPMSIVKELIDNSIDAGASKITVDLIAGGVQKIRVHDNGCGIFYPDLLHLAKNHYTSKLTDLTDLYRFIPISVPIWRHDFYIGYRFIPISVNIGTDLGTWPLHRLPISVRSLPISVPIRDQWPQIGNRFVLISVQIGTDLEQCLPNRLPIWVGQ